MNKVKKLHPNVVPYWKVKELINACIWLLIFSLPFVVQLVWLHEWWWLTYSSIALMGFIVLKTAFFILVGVNAKYSRRSYNVTNDEIMIQWGSFWADRSSIIPMNRVQHVDKEEGIIAMKYGISEITIHTAGEAHYIVGLLQEDAVKLREEIIRLAKLDDQEVYND